MIWQLGLSFQLFRPCFRYFLLPRLICALRFHSMHDASICNLDKLDDMKNGSGLSTTPDSLNVCMCADTFFCLLWMGLDTLGESKIVTQTRCNEVIN